MREAGARLRGFDGLEIREGEVHHPRGILILGVVAVEHHGDDGEILLPGPIYQGIHGDGGVARLSADDVRAVLVLPVGLDHLVAGGDSLAVRELAVGRKLIVGRPHDAGEGIILKCRRGDKPHVIGADVVGGIVQAARIREVGIHAAQGLRLLIHQNRKVLCGAGYVLRQGVGRFIGGF